MKIIIEVGCNNGNDTQWLSEECDYLYGFEPNPELFLNLKERFKDNPKIKIFPYAIDIEEKTREFYISRYGDCGSSSLYPYADNLSETELSRYSCYVNGHDGKCEVESIRLDSFIEDYNIKEISYLWIDAEGNDFKVLQSLGKYIDIVKEGRAEVNYKIDNFKDADNHYEDVKKWLEERGFKTEILYIHEHETAIDIGFKKVNIEE